MTDQHLDAVLAAEQAADAAAAGVRDARGALRATTDDLTAKQAAFEAAAKAESAKPEEDRTPPDKLPEYPPRNAARDGVQAALALLTLRLAAEKQARERLEAASIAHAAAYPDEPLYDLVDGRRVRLTPEEAEAVRAAWAAGAEHAAAVNTERAERRLANFDAAVQAAVDRALAARG